MHRLPLLLFLLALLPLAASEQQLIRIDSVYDYKLLEKAANAQATTETPGLVARARAGALADIDEVVLAIRHRGGGHYYETFGYEYFDPENDRYSRSGGQLIRLNVHSSKWSPLLEDPGGALRDPCVSFDGQRILFSWLRSGEKYWQIYEMDRDGSNIRRITQDTFDDVEPIYLPDGDIVFVSSRAGRGVPCWRTPVGLLHRCEADGSDIRLLSNGIEHEIRPWLLPDGRLIYNRWEYINRSATAFHHLWSMNPDGTGSMTYYGNHHPGFAITEARPIPDSDQILCIFGPGHGRNERLGYLTLLSAAEGPDAKHAAQVISQTSPVKGHGAPGVWRDPHPLSKDCYLVCCEDGLYVMDHSGAFECLWRIPADAFSESQQLSRHPLWLHEPMPLQAHPAPPSIPERVDYTQDHATLVLQDVRAGRDLADHRGEAIDRLLVMEALPMPVSFNWTRDTASIGSGMYNLKRILGTVPVEADGSAAIRVPAMHDVYFIALDNEDNVVKEMKSFVCLMPGETTSCVGCHERRTQAPHRMPKSTLQALTRAPSRIKALPGVPDSGIYDYPRDIQPLFSKHCASCHNWQDRAGDLILSDDIGVRGHHSLYFLARAKLNEQTRLLSYFDGEHHQVQATQAELTTLRGWLYTHAQYSGTYGSFGTAGDGTGLPWTDPRGTDRAPLAPHLRLDTTVLEQRCDHCHVKERRYQSTYTGRTWPFGMPFGDYYNIRTPDQSLLLLAPLAKSAGGLELCRNRPAKAFERRNRRSKTLITDGEPLAIFENRQDPDFQSLAAGMHLLAEQMLRGRIFPVANWRPIPDLLREMKRYGALPPEFDIHQDEVDPFALDEAYYRLYYPGGMRCHAGLARGE